MPSPPPPFGYVMPPQPRYAPQPHQPSGGPPAPGHARPPAPQMAGQQQPARPTSRGQGPEDDRPTVPTLPTPPHPSAPRQASPVSLESPEQLGVAARPAPRADD